MIHVDIKDWPVLAGRHRITATVVKLLRGAGYEKGTCRDRRRQRWLTSRCFADEQKRQPFGFLGRAVGWFFETGITVAGSSFGQRPFYRSE